jgi:light-regulated signal transduction histidine kinase (bacteriophytochrome)
MTPDEKVALHNCESEPVHIPGYIQSFGAVCGFSLDNGEVLYQSENLSPLIFNDDRTFLGQHYEALVESHSALHAIRGALGLPSIRDQRDYAGRFEAGVGQVDIAVFSTPTTAVVEFERCHATQKAPVEQSPVAMVRSMMAAVTDGNGVQPLLETAVRALRHLTAHDRVMAYRFLDNGDGEVVAEAAGPGIEPYLGLRYPAWDIPAQVRQVMLRAPFRIIADIHDSAAGLLAAADSPPLDLTLSHLRGISPIHVEYLENMGVRATMNISIIVRGKLWGIFAFHHYRARHIGQDQRMICELFGQLVSMMILQEEERTRLVKRTHATSVLTSIESAGTTLGEVTDLLADSIQEIMSADGLTAVEPGAISSYGDTPADSVTRRLLEDTTEDQVAIESIADVRRWPDESSVGKSAGVLLQRLMGDRCDGARTDASRSGRLRC